MFLSEWQLYSNIQMMNTSELTCFDLILWNHKQKLTEFNKASCLKHDTSWSKKREKAVDTHIYCDVTLKAFSVGGLRK